MQYVGLAQFCLAQDQNLYILDSQQKYACLGGCSEMLKD